MYVDKTLTGLAAVQTLVAPESGPTPTSRATFVLDFRNDIEDIQNGHSPTGTCGPRPHPPIPIMLFDTHAELGPYGVIRTDEVETMVGFLLDDPQNATTSGSTRRCNPRSTATTPSTRTARISLPRRAGTVHPYLQLPVASGVVHRGQAGARLPVLSAPGSQLIRPETPAGVDLGATPSNLLTCEWRRPGLGDGSLDVEGGGEIETIYGGADRRPGA